MTQIEQQKAAKEFAEFWKDKGDEKQESQRFWIQLLQNVLGVSDPAAYIEFEKRVQLKHTSYIDAYIAETKVLIEQKGIKIDLHKAYEQSDGQVLTPFQQAKRYVSEMKASEKPRWIVVCNFAEFLVYDLEVPNSEPQQILLKDLENDFYRLQFLVDKKNENIRKEEELSKEAGRLVGKLYDAMYKEYIPPEDAASRITESNKRGLSENQLRSLNILCVRIVFCLYAEDAGLFLKKTSVEDYIKSFALENLRDGIIKLFKALDTKEELRDKYDTKIKAFPYVNGGLFAAEDIEIPNFNDEIVDVIVNHCAPFNWSDISPTIFGAVFESTLNQETRRKGGMHYTSIENIHKVLAPLFLDSLNAEFDAICSVKSEKSRNEKLLAFQKKLGSLKFLDPACGSGNFLTESYLCLRRLENECIKLRLGRQQTALDIMGDDFAIQVKISQFYGIEINDFAVAVAKTALWIAESQMMEETARILNSNLTFLPLTTNAFIVEGNALRMDWSTLKPLEENTHPTDGLFSGFTTETDGTKHEYDYIMGNPPFVGYGLQSDSQKKDMLSIYVDEKGKPYKTAGKIDYVSAWYYKACQLMHKTKTKAALVSTNSITQGEQVVAVWKPLVDLFDIQIDFAWRTFRWDSESSEKAHVHCVIIGFTCHSELVSESQKEKIIFDENGNKNIVKNINGYLLDAPHIWVESSSKPLCDVPEMTTGNRPADGGNLIIEDFDYDEFIKKEPESKKFIKKLLGSEEFINNKKRWCLWLVNISPAQLKGMKEVYKRVALCKADREASPDAGRRKLADTPHLFRETNNPEHFLLVPKVSSERRRYIPIGFFGGDTISTDLNFIIPDASLYHFGVLTSSVHNSWMRAICGRLKSDYRYSKDIVYNNFPWCSPTDEQKAKIEQTAQAILDARAKYPDSSLADLYDETLMPQDLRKAHEANDKAVMQAYGFKPNMSESEIVAELFKLYEKLTAK